MAQEPIEARWFNGKYVKNEAGEDIKDYDKAIVDFDFGENLADASAQFGEEAIYNLYIASARVQLQGAIRAQGEAGVSPEEIGSRLATYKPGVRMGRAVVDPVAALKVQYANADEEGKAVLLQKIMGEED